MVHYLRDEDRPLGMKDYGKWWIPSMHRQKISPTDLDLVLQFEKTNRLLIVELKPEGFDGTYLLKGQRLTLGTLAGLNIHSLTDVAVWLAKEPAAAYKDGPLPKNAIIEYWKLNHFGNAKHIDPIRVNKRGFNRDIENFGWAGWTE